MEKLFQKNKNKGFTLFEVLIVIAIMLLLTTLSITGLHSFSSRSNHTSAAHTILGALEEAQARTLACDGDTAYGVHFEPTQVVIFQGTSYTAGAPENDIRQLPARTTISNLSIGGGNDVFFTRLNGSTSSTGTVTVALIADTNINRVITIYESGLSEIST